jgi:DNA invertase Pin-like site-specific DNA recombinase
MPDRAATPKESAKDSRTGSPTGGCAADETSPTPPDTTDSRQRAVAYVRESTEEQGKGFSPDAQRETIRRFAIENDLELVGEYCDFHSGWRKSEARPEFQRLMADAAEGRFDVVLVFHTSRFARSQIEARRYKQLLRERLGIRVVSVTQPMGDDPSDPSSFLAESIHEMFDEYYSVSLSFWTRSGLREKARQGYLVGSLPWGYVRDPQSKLAIPDPKRAPLVRELFERYATGQESDRSLAHWLDAKGARTARDRQFGKDTVREMLSNAAYAGYVSGLRDKTRAIRGLHEAIITDELFDQVQEIRSWRTRVIKPGRPSEDYLLRKLLHCEQCGARMHGTRGSRAGIRRYQCSTRRHHGNCEQAMVKAEPLEDQLVNWLHAFQPDAELRQLVLDTIHSATQRHPGEDQQRRRELLTQLDRLQDLYVLGDLTKPRYIMRRQALEEELQRLAPPADPQLDRAQELLGDFAGFWRSELEPAERRKLIASLFDHIWQDNGQIIAVKPHAAFADYFKTLDQARTHTQARTRNQAKVQAQPAARPSKPPKPDQKSGVTKAGATGLEPATSGVTGRRSNQLSYAPARTRDRDLASHPRANDEVCQAAAAGGGAGSGGPRQAPSDGAGPHRAARRTEQLASRPVRGVRLRAWRSSAHPRCSIRAR